MGGGYCGPDFSDGMNIVPGPCFPEPTDIAVSGQFVITASTCPSSLNSPLTTSVLSCSVHVAFSPASRGPQSGFLRLVSSPSIVGVPLAGQGCKQVKGKNGKKKRSCVAKTPKKKKKGQARQALGQPLRPSAFSRRRAHE